MIIESIIELQRPFDWLARVLFKSIVCHCAVIVFICQAWEIYLLVVNSAEMRIEIGPFMGFIP